MEQITIKKRTPEEQEAYWQGYAAGKRAGATEQHCMVFAAKVFAPEADYRQVREEILKQKEEGVILLSPAIEYRGTVSGEADVKIVVKKAKAQTNEGAGYEDHKNNSDM